jgi:hypothetical protein
MHLRSEAAAWVVLCAPAIHQYPPGRLWGAVGVAGEHLRRGAGDASRWGAWMPAIESSIFIWHGYVAISPGRNSRQEFKERLVDMRILVALAVVVVFAAMFVFDTAALVRLGVLCVTGGCGVHPLWFAIGGGIALAVLLSLRRPRVPVKIARVTKRGPSRPSRGKAGPRRKPKPAK